MKIQINHIRFNSKKVILKLDRKLFARDCIIISIILPINISHDNRNTQEIEIKKISP